MDYGCMFKGWSVAIATALFAAPFTGMAQEPGPLRLAAAIGEEQVLPKTPPKASTTVPAPTTAKSASAATTATETTTETGTAATTGMSTGTMVMIGIGAAALLAAVVGGGGSSSHPQQ